MPHRSLCGRQLVDSHAAIVRFPDETGHGDATKPGFVPAPFRSGRQCGEDAMMRSVESSYMVETSYLAVAVVGAVRAVRRERPARVAGIELPGTPRQQAFTVGTPLSAPPLMLVALVVAGRRGRSDIERILAILFIVGIAGEADTWSALRKPTADLLATTCVLLDVALPTAMLRRSR